MRWGALIGAVALACAAPASAQAFDHAPWLADLEQVRQAIHQKYANLEWLERDRGVAIDPLFDDLAKRLRRARNDAQAMAVFNRLVTRMGDGHVAIDWPEPPGSEPATTAATAGTPDLCSSIGYDARQNGPGTAQGLTGYHALASTDGNPFGAGVVESNGVRVGIIRIGVFQPQGYPELCRAAVRTFAIPANKPCDDGCQDKILTWAYQRMTGALEERARQLKAAAATVLLVDISNNGGGSEWAEAAARIFSAKQLVSGRRGFVRGEHWAKQWSELARDLRDHAKRASPMDRQRLLGWAADAESAMRAAERPCPPTASTCSRIATAGYATGLVGSAPASAFVRKDWGVLVFSPAQFPYHDGVWNGPLIVLTDQQTWSAAEEFAAVLQDNKAAVIMGARTGGAGCGHTNGGTPTTLSNSRAVLELPDCVRYRPDGSNEVRGIIPDELVALRANDGLRFKAALIEEKLPSAIARCWALQKR